MHQRKTLIMVSWARVLEKERLKLHSSLDIQGKVVIVDKNSRLAELYMAKKPKVEGTLGWFTSKSKERIHCLEDAVHQLSLIRTS